MEEIGNIRFYKYIRENMSSNEIPNQTFVEHTLLKSTNKLFRIIPENNLHHFSSQGIYLYEVELDWSDPNLICQRFGDDPDQYETNALILKKRLSTLEKNKAIFHAGCVHKHINFLSTRVRFAFYDDDIELLKYMGAELQRYDLYNLVEISDKIIDVYH